MKIYYKYDKYNCSILWNRGFKLTIFMPLNDYLSMTTDIRDCSMEFHFKLLISKFDKNNSELINHDGLWVIDSKVIKGIINSKSSEGNVEVIFSLLINSSIKGDSIEEKNLILDNIFKNEKGE